MAESIITLLIPQLTTFITFLTTKVVSSILEKYESIEKLRGEVQYIRAELESMHAFLSTAQAKQDDDVLDDEQKAWIKQVMEVAFDAEDVVDEILLLAHSNKWMEARLQISKISDIKNRVKDISERHQRFESAKGISATSSRRISYENSTQGDVREDGLVGIDPPKRVIIALLLSSESHLKAISVVGMGGLGKTTLVKRVYEASDVKREFSIRAWLTISKTFIIEDALKDLIRQLIKIKRPKNYDPREVDSMDKDGLKAFVRDLLKDNRYIIVLDDLWKLDHWESISSVFPNKNCASRIIITTRINEVANRCRKDFLGNVHTMHQLSTHGSWKLFRKMTFGEDQCPDYLRKIARKIMSKCEGLPLGIVEISHLLKSKGTQGEWDLVLRSLGGELEASGKLDRVRKILLRSYNDLPYRLKRCLMYMGMFPEDAIVHRFEIRSLWMVEGFVEASQGKTAIEVAEIYLNELIGRSLIQVVDAYPDRRVDHYRVHGLIHKIILSKCKECNMLPAALTPNTVQLENVRHLGVVESNFPIDPAHLLRLRSIILSRESSKSISDSSLSKLLQVPSKLLKVLYLDSSNLKNVPDVVFKFSNLTYLDLSNTDVTKIPKSISMLQNLEWLFLYRTQVKELPADIKNLKKLYGLTLGGSIIKNSCNYLVSGVKAPSGLGELSSLQLLCYIEADSEKVIREIGELTQLRELGITMVTRANGKKLRSSLEKLTNLRELYIQTKTREEIIDLEDSPFPTLEFLQRLVLVGSLEKIPKWVPSCHDLSIVSLLHSCLKKNPLGSLEGMRNLAYLRLDDAYTGKTLHFRGFQKLKTLVLGNLSRLKSMSFEKGALPDLKTLTIVRCELMEKLPQDIQYLSKLQTLDLQNMPTRLGNSLRDLNKERHQKIAHISEIKIGSDVKGKLKVEYLKR